MDDKLWIGRDLLGRKIVEYDEYQKLQQRIKQLEDTIQEAVEVRKSMPFSASGIRIDVRIIANTMDRMFDILQKALGGK